MGTYTLVLDQPQRWLPRHRKEYPMRILAVDPGNTESGWCVIDPDTQRPLRFGKTPNDELHHAIRSGDFLDCHNVAIEMIASYGMAVGKEVFATCVWIGRYYEATCVANPFADLNLVYRRDIKLHHCGNARAKDTNITQALVDRYAPGQPNRGKGTKAHPGWFHGFRADVWQAYALAVFAADTLAPHAATTAAGDPLRTGAVS